MNSWSIENESDTTSSSYVEIEKLKDILLQQQQDEEQDDEIYDEDDEDIDIDELDGEDEEVYGDEEEDIYEEDELDYEEEEEEDEEDEESKSNSEEDNILISPATLATPESTSLSPLLVSSENGEEVVLNDSKREVAKLPNIDEPAYLEYEWVFYYDDSTLKGQTSDDYQSYIKNLGSFNTVQGFWGYWNNIINSSMFPDGANLRLFKQGIAPMWEDPCNENGGKWTLSCYKEQSHNIALKTILALIGEQLDHSYDICGFVLSVRSSRHVISVWNKSGDVKEIHDKTSEQLKECVMGKVFKYYPHKQLGNSSGSVPPSPMTPSVSSNSLSSYNNNNYSTTPMKREYSSPMISSNNNHNNNNSRLTQSTSISNDLYKETNNNCNNSNNNNNNSNNLISSFENVNNNRKETFKHKKSQSASSIYTGGSGVSTCSNNSNNSNNNGGNTPLKSSGKILRKENSKSNIILSSIEISSSKDHINIVNKVDENSIVVNNISIEQTQQQEILYKSNSKEDIKLKKQPSPQSPQQQQSKKTYKDKSTSSATPSKPPLKDRTIVNNTTSPIINVMATVVIPKDEAVNIITAATTTPVIEPVTLFATSASASASSSSLVEVEVKQPVEPKDEYNESRELLRSNLLSSEEKIIDSSPNDEGTDPFTNDELMENISEISDFHTDESSLSNNRKSKSKKKSKSKSNGSSTGSINNSNINSSKSSSSHKSNSSNSKSSNLRKNTLKGNSKHHHQKGLNSSLLSLDEDGNQLGLVQKSTSIFNSPTLNFCKEHFLVFFMIFGIISLTVILQKQ